MPVHKKIPRGKFFVENRNPPRLRCVYCDRILLNISDNLI